MSTYNTFEPHSIGLYGEVRHVHEQVGKDGLPRLAEDEEDYEHPTTHAPARTLSLFGAAMVQCSDVVGAGLLTLAGVVGSCGWVALGLSLVLAPLVAWMGNLLAMARQTFPFAYTYHDMAKMSMGNRLFTMLVDFFFYGFQIMAMAAYQVGMAQSMAMVFYNSSLCQPLWGCMILVFLIGPVQLRTLGHAQHIMVLNIGFVTMAIVLVLGYLLVNMSSHRVTHPEIETSFVKEDATWVQFMNSVSLLTYAYVSFISLEIMAEMKEPETYGKSYWISSPFQVLLYSLIGAVGYAYGGQFTHDSILKQIHPLNDDYAAMILQWAAALLLLHLMISYIIKAIIVTRAIHAMVHPESINSHTFAARLLWFYLSCVVLFTTFFLANAMPIFGSIVSLTGSLMCPLLGFCFPVVFYVAAKTHKQQPIGAWEKLGLLGTLCFGIMLLLFGTAANFIDFLHQMEATQQSPFQCIHQSFIDEKQT